MPYAKPEDQRAAARRWDEANRGKRRALNKAWEDGERAKLADYKRGLKCERCPEADPDCLDFHHADPSTKEVTVAWASKRGWSFKKIMAEIEKCIVLCANCHRKEHSSRRRGVSVA